jgi:RNA polymerase sigma factor (sigma-70 family)
MNEVTRVLSAIEQGDPRAAEQLLPLVYDELRKLAAQKMAQEAPGQTLEATALVHEAYLRLVGERRGVSSGERRGVSPTCSENAQAWNSRGHFFIAAAEAMRRILIEKARRKRRVRHGGGRTRLDFERLDVAAEAASQSMLDLDQALVRLAAEEAAVVEVVKLRYFAGLTIEQTAAALGISVRTANRHWAYAKAWLYRQLNEGQDVVE